MIYTDTTSIIVIKSVSADFIRSIYTSLPYSIICIIYYSENARSGLAKTFKKLIDFLF